MVLIKNGLEIKDSIGVLKKIKMIWEILGQKFYRDFEVLNSYERFEILSDIKDDIKSGHIARGVPHIQTVADAYNRHGQKIHWNLLLNFFKNKIKTYTGKDVRLYQSWANLSNEENDYKMHSHETDLTCVYFVKGKRFEYGTNFESFIIPFVENSTLIFNGQIKHSIINMPHELAHQKLNHRYTLVFDFNYIL